jgi:hypothetical protein
LVSHHEERRGDMRACRKEMKADREATETYPENMDANPEEEVPKQRPQ